MKETWKFYWNCIVLVVVSLLSNDWCNSYEYAHYCMCICWFNIPNYYLLDLCVLESLDNHKNRIGSSPRHNNDQCDVDRRYLVMSMRLGLRRSQDPIIKR